MEAWRPADSLLQLRDQINAAWPDRAKGADGTIGDTAHSNRVSDHNPNALGVVCALDITHDPKHGVDILAITNSLAASRDDRISYMIRNAMTLSATGQHAWRWVPYDGNDPHRNHFHISVKTGRCDVRGPWAIGVPEDTMDQDTSITQASDVSIGAAKGGTLTRPLRWWLSAAYAHIIGLEGPLKKIGDSVAAQGLQLAALTASQAALTAAQVLQATAQTALLKQVQQLVALSTDAVPAHSSPVDVDALAERVVARLGDANASDIARRIGNG
jgi:hypothetical protein